MDAQNYYRSGTEVSIIGTSPDFVQSLDFLVSRFLSGTRLESGLGLDKIWKIFFRFVQSLSRQESVLDLVQIRIRLRKTNVIEKSVGKEKLKSFKLEIFQLENLKLENFRDINVVEKAVGKNEKLESSK